jgi:hypothetical protein
MIWPIITAAIAIYFGVNWKRTLRNDRIDKCVGALFTLQAFGDRTVALANKATNASGTDDQRAARAKAMWVAYDRVWDGWRDFRQSYEVMRRYYEKKLDYKKLEAILFAIEGIEDSLSRLYDHPPTVKLAETRSAFDSAILQAHMDIREKTHSEWWEL